MIDNPQPAWLPVLLLALPGIAFAALALNQAIFLRDERPLCTIPAVSMVLALLPTHVLALVFGSLSIGLAGAWSVVGLAGYVWVAQHWREARIALSQGRAGRAGRLGVAVLATLPIVLPTILLDFHDETYFNGHHAIIAHLQNGIYPPRYLYDPDLPLRYHYAFDLAGAIVTGLLRIRVDQAVDLLTIALWPCMFLLLRRFGEHMGGRRAGLFVALAVCFSGGWPALAWSGSPCGFCTVNGLRINHAFIQYFFQHPWSIGLPIFCLVVLQRAALPCLANRALGIAALICSLSLLSLAQAVLFVTTVVALGLSDVWNIVRFRDRSAVASLLCLGASLLIAKLLGGFFVSGAFAPAAGLLGTGLYIHDFAGPGAVLGQVQWNVASFGGLLVIGIVGLHRMRREKVFLTTLAALSLTIVNLLHYGYTWDIVKFGVVSFLVLAVGAGVALSDLASWANSRGRRVVLGLIILALIGQGAPYPFVMLLAVAQGPRPSFSIQMVRPYLSLTYPVGRDDAQAVSFLRTHMGSSEIVYRAREKSEPYAIWGGLPTQASVFPADNGKDDVYGFGEKKFAARKDLVNISESWFDRLAAEHVTWVAVDPDDVAIDTILQCPQGRDRAVLAAQYGEVRIFRIR
jgi:hypothetical protein